MLNVSTVAREVHTDNLLVVGVDVSKGKLDLYADHTDPAESRRQELDGQVPNRRKRPIEEKNGASCGEAPLSGASLQIDGSISEISGRRVLKKRLLCVAI